MQEKNPDLFEEIFNQGILTKGKRIHEYTNGGASNNTCKDRFISLYSFSAMTMIPKSFQQVSETPIIMKIVDGGADIALFRFLYMELFSDIENVKKKSDAVLSYIRENFLQTEDIVPALTEKIANYELLNIIEEVDKDKPYLTKMWFEGITMNIFFPSCEMKGRAASVYVTESEGTMSKITMLVGNTKGDWEKITRKCLEVIALIVKQEVSISGVKPPTSTTKLYTKEYQIT